MDNNTAATVEATLPTLTGHAGTTSPGTAIHTAHSPTGGQTNLNRHIEQKNPRWRGLQVADEHDFVAVVVVGYSDGSGVAADYAVAQRLVEVLEA